MSSVIGYENSRHSDHGADETNAGYWIMMGLKRLLIFACLAAATTGLTAPALAQEVVRIAAVVNEDVISVYDLMARTRLLMLSLSAPNNAETQRRLMPRVLRTLINEMLQLQEAKRLGITVSQSDIDVAIDGIAQRNKMDAKALVGSIEAAGIPISAMNNQVEAGLAWQKVVRRRIAPNVDTGDEEVDEVITRIKSSKGLVEYRVAEIFLAIDSPNDEQQVLQEAQRITNQARGGAPFDQLAAQFSQSPTAAVGGDIGWVKKGQLQSEIDAVLGDTTTGKVTEPIRTFAGYYIVMLRERRSIQSSQGAKLMLQQVQIPASSDNSSTLTAQESRVGEIAAAFGSCEAVPQLVDRFGLPKPPEPQQVELSDLSGLIRDAVENLPVGQASDPIRLAKGWLLVMVCAREDAPPKEPDRRLIADQLSQSRIGMLARRYLRDLRRSAFVDLRV